jgi:hypothetical protein
MVYVAMLLLTFVFEAHAGIFVAPRSFTPPPMRPAVSASRPATISSSTRPTTTTPSTGAKSAGVSPSVASKVEVAATSVSGHNSFVYRGLSYTPYYRNGSVASLKKDSAEGGEGKEKEVNCISPKNKKERKLCKYAQNIQKK